MTNYFQVGYCINSKIHVVDNSQLRVAEVSCVFSAQIDPGV